MTLIDVALVVCTALDEAGTKAVLTGGGAATAYAPKSYESQDLDYVITFGGGRPAVEALADLGFETRPEKHYTHPGTRFTVEFPPGPLAVGDDFITSWDTLRRGDLLLHIITPTDSVRDRLSAYLHWNDLGSLEVALAVAKAQRDRIDLALVEDWCRREGAADKFELFRRRLG